MEHESKLRVSQFIIPGEQWNKPMVQNIVNHEYVEHILSITIPMEGGGTDIYGLTQTTTQYKSGRSITD